MIEGQVLPMAFPVVADNNGRGVWEALDWKILKEAKSAVTQYGLKSPYTQSILQHIFSAQLLTPYDSRMIVQTLLPPSQQLQFFSNIGKLPVIGQLQYLDNKAIRYSESRLKC